MYSNTQTQCQHQKTSYQWARRQISLWANSTLHRTAGRLDYITSQHHTANMSTVSCRLVYSLLQAYWAQLQFSSDISSDSGYIKSSRDRQEQVVDTCTIRSKSV